MKLDHTWRNTAGYRSYFRMLPSTQRTREHHLNNPLRLLSRVIFSDLAFLCWYHRVGNLFDQGTKDFSGAVRKLYKLQTLSRLLPSLIIHITHPASAFQV